MPGRSEQAVISCAHGIAVLRFHTAGRGGSEADFANADVSTNVADLVAAAEHLRETGGEPELLVGHGLGGGDAGPNPYELLLAALGACTSMTLRMYANRKQWPLEHVEVRLRHDRVHARDCAVCDSDEGLIDRLTRDVLVRGPLDEGQRARLLEIADRCPVHRTLMGEKQIPTRLVEG